MRRLAFGLSLLVACARSTTSSDPDVSTRPAYAAQEGDTVVILMHRVRPDKRAEYERFMTEVWFPRAQKFGAKHPEFGAALARRWRLVGTQPAESDSLFTYMFLYPVFETAGNASDMWRQIGVPADQVARDSAVQASLVEHYSGFMAVRREYARERSPSSLGPAER